MRQMTRALIVATVLVVFVSGLAACSPKFEDLTTVNNDEGSSTLEARVVDPDSVTIYRNVDQFPNVGVMCVNGDAFVYRSTNYEDFVLTHLPSGTHNLCS